MGGDADEEALIKSTSLQNLKSILAARQRAEGELVAAKSALETKSQELARSLAMMRATLEATADGILVTSSDRAITGFNERFLAIWGLTLEDLATNDHRQLVGVISRRFADPDAFGTRVEEIYEASPKEAFTLLETLDGRSIERSSRIQVVDGVDMGRVWSFRDVTERKRAEAALQDETRVLELLNDTGIAIASTLDVHALLQSVTDAGTQLIGAKFGAFFYTGRDASGAVFQLFTISGAPREAFERFGHPRPTALFAPTFEGKPPVRIGDVHSDPRYGKMAPHFGMPKGHLPVRSYLAVSVRTPSGEVVGGLFFGHPDPNMFSERSERIIEGIAAQAGVAVNNARLFQSERSAREEAERVSLMKDEFLATLSHELRTPLNSIVGWSQILQDGECDESDLEEGLDAIARNARSQTQLIEDLLDMSRIVSGKIRLDVQPMDLSVVIDAAVASVRPSAEAKGIRLRKIIDPVAGPVAGDPNRLQQIVWNLLSNSVKFTPKGGSIDVVLERVNCKRSIVPG